MTDTIDPVDLAMQKAAEAAAAVDVAPQATAATTAVATASPVAAAATPSKANFMAGATADTYLKVTEHGLFSGSTDDIDKRFSFLIADLDLENMQMSTCVKYGKPVRYVKTYDGIIASNGRSWNEALAEARQEDPNVKTYESADLELEVVEDVKTTSGEVVVKAGEILGHSTSTTNQRNLAKLMKTVQKTAGTTDCSVRVKVGFEARKKDSWTWGLLTFELIEVLD